MLRHIRSVPCPLLENGDGSVCRYLHIYLGFFLILELLDRTLRDSIRTRRLIGLPMLGAFPKDSILEYHNYVEESKV